MKLLQYFILFVLLISCEKKENFNTKETTFAAPKVQNDTLYYNLVKVDSSTVSFYGNITYPNNGENLKLIHNRIIFYKENTRIESHILKEKEGFKYPSYFFNNQMDIINLSKDSINATVSDVHFDGVVKYYVRK